MRSSTRPRITRFAPPAPPPARAALLALAALLWAFCAAAAAAPGSAPDGGRESVQERVQERAQEAFPAAVQSARVRFSLGVANQPVAEAWNPLQLELRDAPASTLTLQIDQGTLRSGEVPLVVTYAVRGGAGISIFDELLYLPRFARLSWRLATPERVLASGSVAGREADDRALDLLLTSNPGAYRLPYVSAFGGDSRLVDVTATGLPEEPAAYDGVRSLVIDGSAAAPRLEAVAAAVAGGAAVLLLGPLPASHAELELLLGGATAARLGAGALLYSEAEGATAVEALSRADVPRRGSLLAALLEEPLVEAPAPLKETMLALMIAAYALTVLLLVRWAGAPGLSAALALAGLLSLVGWRLFRPEAPQLQGRLTLALAGDSLALNQPALEVLTLPRAIFSLPEAARPLRAQAYSVDDAGTHIALERWRSVLLELAPRLGEAQLVVVDGQPRNLGAAPLRDLYLVGEGRLGDLAAGASAPSPSEAETFGSYARLTPLLPEGSWLARSECVADCTVWVVYPPLSEPTVMQTGLSGSVEVADPFRTAGEDRP